MRIIYDLLVQHNACIPQRDAFRALYPDGCEPTVDVLFDLVSEDLDAWWLYRLLPAEGPGSQRAYALWCAEQVAHLNTDRRVIECLDLVRRHVERQDVSREQLAAARDAAWVAARDAARDAARVAAWVAARVAAWVAARVAAWVAARVAAWVAARVAAEAAQLACLSQLLLEAP